MIFILCFIFYWLVKMFLYPSHDYEQSHVSETCLKDSSVFGFKMCVLDFWSNNKHLACILLAQIWSFCMYGQISHAWRNSAYGGRERDDQESRAQIASVWWFGLECWCWGFRLISHPVRHSWMMEDTPPQPSMLSSTFASLQLHLWLSILSICIYFLPLMQSLFESHTSVSVTYTGLFFFNLSKVVLNYF